MQSQILTDLVHILETGTEADVTQFVKEHWKDFPQKLQDDLGAAMLMDAIDEHVQEKQDFETIRQDFFDALEELDKQDSEEDPK